MKEVRYRCANRPHSWSLKHDRHPTAPGSQSVTMGSEPATPRECHPPSRSFTGITSTGITR
ncbi:MAG: hypothetical protein WD136_01410, partial [Cyanobium sp.]